MLTSPRHFSIFSWTLIGNSLVIIIGAIGGTLLTRQFALVGDVKLIILFVTFGILLSLIVNYWVLRIVLRPLREFPKIVDQVKEEQTTLSISKEMLMDPDIHELVEAVNAMLERLAKRTVQLRALTESSINAQEEERKRIARWLHDDTAQAISMLIIHLEQVENSLPENLPMDFLDNIHNQLKAERLLAAQILEELRKNIWGLRPSILDDLGLAPAIRWYARSKLEDVGIKVEFDLGNGITLLGSPLEVMLFRISQEAINNIRYHSNAHSAIIRLWQVEDQIFLEVEDDGQGFDVSQTVAEALSQKHLGLIGIQERTSLIDGRMKIDSVPGRGTILHVCVPLLANNLPLQPSRTPPPDHFMENNKA